MGLEHRIIVRTTGPGSKVINEFLQTWQLTDLSGESTDQIRLQVAAPDLDSLPPEGAAIGFELGLHDQDNTVQWYDRGKYLITRIIPRLYPRNFTIVATAAPFQVDDQTEFKLRRSQTYTNTTLGDVFRHVVKRHGLSPRVDQELDRIPIAHLDQTDETDMSFLTRVARQYDAVAKPIDQLYVLGRRGNIKSLSGKRVEPIAILLPTDNRPSDSSFTNASITFPSRQQFKGVKSQWWDDGTGKNMTEQVGDKPFKKLVQIYPDAVQAKQAAEDELRKVVRTGTQLSLDLPADPRYHAEGIISTGVQFPAYMQGRWSLDKVVMTGGKQGARAQLTATLTFS